MKGFITGVLSRRDTVVLYNASMEETAGSASRPRVELHQGDGVLMIRLGAVGDVVRTLPSLARLRECHPRIRLGWIVERPCAPLIPMAPWVDELFVFPRQDLAIPRLWAGAATGWKTVRRFLSGLKGFSAKVVLDFQGTAKTGLVARFSGAPYRIGFDRSGSREGSHLLSSLQVHPSSPRLNRVHKNLELLAPLGVHDSPLSFPFPPEPPPARLNEFLSQLGKGPRIAIHAGTSRRQDHKRWPAASYARLLELLREESDAVPILCWGPGERGLVRRIQELAPDRAIAAPSTTLLELRSLLGKCQLFVGGDTGPMHLAWTQGIPVVALFGATDPAINGPLGVPHRIVAPAWGDNCPPPERGDASVMRTISPERVWKEIRASLSDIQAMRGAD